MADQAPITVELGERSYPILVEMQRDWNQLKGFIGKRKAFIITDEMVGKLYLDELKNELGIDHAFTIPAGEQSKSLEQSKEIFGALIEARADRSTTVIIALGGGVVGDLAGFVAATYMRGIPFIQIPTTLLSMVDSSVGGKTAVNHPMGKNMIGCFYQPEAVYISSEVLKTLDKRELLAGMAEVIKYGIIWDREFFQWLKEHRNEILALDPDALSHIISVSVKIKAEVVSKDEHESSGLRSLLNLGHTFGHAEEVLMGYGKRLHGEAVAAGMVAAAKVSLAMKKITQNEYDEIHDLIHSYDLPVTLESWNKQEEFWEVMRGDKKSVGGEVRFILPEGIGKASLPMAVDDATVNSALNG